MGTTKKDWKEVIVVKIFRVTAAAALSAVIAGLLVSLGLGWWPSHATAPSEKVSRIRVTPGIVVKRVSYYGETLNATFTVIVNEDIVDSLTVSPQTKFAPYRVVEAKVHTERRGQTTLVRFTYVLRCLDTACLPKLATRALQFSPTSVYFRLRKGSVPEKVTVYWRRAHLASNLSKADLQIFTAYIEKWTEPNARLPFWTNDALPAPSYRWDDQLLIWGTLSLSGLLAFLGFGALVFARRSWLRKTKIESDGTSLEKSALLQALAVAQEILNGVSVVSNDRAWALGLLAEQCEGFGWLHEAETLTTFAWSLDGPTQTGDLRRLADVIAKLRVKVLDVAEGVS